MAVNSCFTDNQFNGNETRNSRSSFLRKIVFVMLIKVDFLILMHISKFHIKKIQKQSGINIVLKRF